MYRDGQRFISRSTDETMKLWDLRNPDAAVIIWDDLKNTSNQAQVCISNNEKIVLTGTSTKSNKGVGKLMGFSTVSGEKICEEAVS